MITVSFWRRAGAITLAVAVIGVVSFAFFIGKEANAQSDSPCVDSDNTPDYYGMGPEQVSAMNDSSIYIRGSIISVVSDGIQHNVDVCETSNKVREHYCDRGKYLAYIILDCPNGCKDGACVGEAVEEPNSEECLDSDNGRDYFVKGETTDFGDTRADSCFNSNTLTEFYCEQAAGQTRPSRGAEQKKCEFGCKDGACVQSDQTDQTCTDSDNGSDYFTKGTVKTSASPQMDYTDICGPGSSEIPAGHELIEWNCDENGGVINEYYNCPNGCKGGACVSDEELARIEKQKQIKEMIKGISGMSGMIKGVNVIEKAFQQIAKQGIATPSELAQAIARVKEIKPAIIKFQNKKAEKVTDEQAEILTDNMSEMCEIGLTLTDWGEQLPQFLQFGAKMQRASKDLKLAKSDVARAVKAAARSKYSLSDKAEELNEAVEALKATLDYAVEITGFDEKGNKINEFYDKFQDIYDTIGVINALQNTGQARAQWIKRVNDNARTISQLKRAKLDVEELTAKNDEVKAEVEELKTALARKPIDRDEIKGVFGDLKILQAEFGHIADQLRGVNSSVPKVAAAKFDTTQFKNFGAFSQFCGVPPTGDNGEEVPE